MSSVEYDREIGFLSKFLETGDIKTVSDYRITRNYLHGENRVVFDYIFNSLSQYGNKPSTILMSSRFPRFKFYHYGEGENKKVGTEDCLVFWCDELRKAYRHNKLAELVESAGNDIDNLETEKAFGDLFKGIARLDSDTVLDSGSVLINDTGEDRKKQYLEKATKKGLLGISTGFSRLDMIIKGLIDECLTTIVASTGIGKTWFEVILAASCLLQGCSVVHFITEMSTRLMQDRYDALLCSRTKGVDIDYNQFSRGTMPKEEMEAYFDYLDDTLPKLEPLYIESATGVIAMEQRIKELNPDIIFVDGVYLMEDDQKAKEDWLRIAHITRDLKKMAKRLKKPVIINTQLDENVAKKVSPKLGDIKYTQAIGQDSDNIIALFRDDVMVNDREMGVKVLKNREGDLGTVTLNWDFTCMDFSEIYGNMDEDEDDGTLSVDDVD